jgi:hypothetical protein
LIKGMSAAMSKSKQWIVFVRNMCVWSLLRLGPKTVSGRDFAIFKLVVFGFYNKNLAGCKVKTCVRLL